MAITQGTTTAITITATTLASGSARESASVTSPVTNNTDDIIIHCKPTIANTALSGDQAVYIYAAGSEDGTDWTYNATGADAAITLQSPRNFRRLGTIEITTNNVAVPSHPMSLRAAFGGAIPRKWSIVIENQCGAAFTAFAASYTETYYT